MANFTIVSKLWKNKLWLSCRNGVSAQKRTFSDSCTGQQLAFKQFGEPLEVVEQVPYEIPSPKGLEVLVKVIHSPINPVDINVIQGKYPIKPTFCPAVPGTEGVGEVIEVGSEGCFLEEGDRVIPLIDQLGWWQTHLKAGVGQLYKIPDELGDVEAATLSVSACTAFRMLKDFICLYEGDMIIQNGANSAVGQMVIQICKNRKIKTINVVRDRPNYKEVADYLSELGGDYIINEKELESGKIFKCPDIPKPKLGLNCVGGKMTSQMMQHLEKNSPFVTYGGMSKKPVTASVGNMVFNNIKLVGFWLTEWRRENFRRDGHFRMLDELSNLMVAGKLKPPLHEVIPFEDYEEAIEKVITKKGMVGKKFILNFETCEDDDDKGDCKVEAPCEKIRDSCKVSSEKKKCPCKNQVESCFKGKDLRTGDKDPCKKKKNPCEKKEDPCEKKEDPCGRKSNLCLKEQDSCSKSTDPCKQKKNPCKKLEDPCGGKSDPCLKKDDPCSKSKDPCTRRENPCKKKEDTCGRKSNPCLKEEDPCSKSTDPCKQKKNPCKKKKDPCGGMSNPCLKKDDPCSKSKDPCKKKLNPCKKKSPCGRKSDPCLKEKNPCSKSKKKDKPCVKNAYVCAKNNDPCGKEAGPCTKKPKPCEETKDSCKEKKGPRGEPKGSCMKKDPCGEMKDDNVKDDPCKKFLFARKENADLHAKQKPPCEKKESPHEKKGLCGGKDPDDPCMKFIVGSKREKCPSKEKNDGCKKEKDTCKKKKDPCGAKQKSPCKAAASKRGRSPCQSKQEEAKPKRDNCLWKKKPCIGVQKKKSCMQEKKVYPKKKETCARKKVTCAKKKETCSKKVKKCPKKK